MLDAFFTSMNSDLLDPSGASNNHGQHHNGSANPGKHPALDFDWIDDLPPTFEGSSTSLSAAATEGTAQHDQPLAGGVFGGSNNTGGYRHTESPLAHWGFTPEVDLDGRPTKRARLDEQAGKQHRPPSVSAHPTKASLNRGVHMTDMYFNLHDSYHHPLPSHHNNSVNSANDGKPAPAKTPLRWGSDVNFCSPRYAVPPNVPTYDDRAKQLIEGMQSCLQTQRTSTTHPSSPVLPPAEVHPQAQTQAHTHGHAHTHAQSQRTQPQTQPNQNPPRYQSPSPFAAASMTTNGSALPSLPPPPQHHFSQLPRLHTQQPNIAPPLQSPLQFHHGHGHGQIHSLPDISTAHTPLQPQAVPIATSLSGPSATMTTTTTTPTSVMPPTAGTATTTSFPVDDRPRKRRRSRVVGDDNDDSSRSVVPQTVAAHDRRVSTTSETSASGRRASSSNVNGTNSSTTNGVSIVGAASSNGVANTHANQNSGASKAARENLTEEQKRTNHILSEQKRRNLIKQGFDDLCALVPELHGGGFSKSTMLVQAAEWLQELLRGNGVLKEQLMALGGAC